MQSIGKKQNKFLCNSSFNENAVVKRSRLDIFVLLTSHGCDSNDDVQVDLNQLHTTRSAVNFIGLLSMSMSCDCTMCTDNKCEQVDYLVFFTTGSNVQDKMFPCSQTMSSQFS